MDRNTQRSLRFGFRMIALGSVVLLAALAAGCSPDKKDDSESKHISVTHTGSDLVIGRAVVALHLPMSGCGDLDHATGNPHHTARTAVTSAGGPTVVGFTLTSGSYPDSYLETYYVDVDNTNSLTFGDIVLGTDPFDMLALCFSTISGRVANDSLDWDQAEIEVGTTTWQDGTQPFSMEVRDDEALSHVSMSFIPGASSFSEWSKR